MNNQKTGYMGETAAAAFLRRKGYTILKSNFRCRFGEVDLIAAKSGYVAFVEVKTRQKSDFASAREFVTGKKRERLRATAELWLSLNDTLLQPRFDVMEVYYDWESGRVREINHIENAF